MLSKAMLKLIMIMGVGIILSLPVPAINKNKVEKIVIKQDNYIYQVNKHKGNIEKIYVFDKEWNCKGVFSYDTLEAKHRKAINEIIK